MPVENSLSFKGLQTSPNNLGAGSEGALVVADNVTIRYPDVLEPRRGQESVAFGNTFGNSVDQVFFFQDQVGLHSNNAGVIRLTGAVSALQGSSYIAADALYKLKTAVSARSLYMATTAGVMALEQASSTVPRLSGIAEPANPKALVNEDPTAPAPTIPGFLDPGKAVAYRVLFGYVDSHNAVHLGPPSVRDTVKNDYLGQASVIINVPLWAAPTDATGAIVSGTFVRVYRSVMANTEGETSDELYLVSETIIDTSQYGLTDVLPIADNARQEFVVQSAPLYTNPTQGGLPNDPPPYARDIANWDSRLWYANTEQPYALAAQLIGVEGGGNPDIPATGLRVGDTVAIDGVVFTGATGSVPASRLFSVYSSGPADFNISQTLEQLAFVVNEWADNNPTFKIRAYLEPVVFGDSTRYFKIRFQRPSVSEIDNAAFNVVYTPLRLNATVTGSAGAYTITTVGNHNLKVGDFVRMTRQPPSSLFPPQTIQVQAPVTATTFASNSTSGTLPQMNRVQRLYGESVWTPALTAGVEADNERRDNGLYYSLPNEPEAVSAASYLTVGTSGRAIKRIVPQRDRLLVFKEEGTYAVYGDFPYQVSLIDDTVQILAPDSAVALGSTVFVLTDDGILAITDGGIQMVSKAIDSTLKPYLARNKRDTTATGAFGVSYESEKVFALFMPNLDITGYEAKAYVYGLESGAWTTWTFGQPRTCGKVDPVIDTAYYGTTATPYLFRDKNNSSTTDYFDSTGPIVSTVQWAATTLGAPYATKQARELHLHYRDLREQAGGTLLATYSIKTDIVRNGQTVDAWSSADEFSTETVIGPAVLPYQFRKLIPQNVQRAAYYTLGLSASIAHPGGYWALNGYSIVYEGTSERTGTVR